MGPTYGKTYGMHKTTVYLPEDVRAQLSQAADRLGQTEAELIRDALRSHLAALGGPAPRLPLFRSNQPCLADDVEGALAGFGER